MLGLQIRADELTDFSAGERWVEFGADELTDFSAGERWAYRWCWVFAGLGSSLKRFFHA